MATSAHEQSVASIAGTERRARTPRRPVESLTRRGPPAPCHPAALPYRASPPADWRAEGLVANDTYVRKGRVLLSRGLPFTALYEVHSGSCKSVITTSDGQEQIAAFHIAGEILGVEAIADGSYGATIVALEDSVFRAMPFDRVNALAQEDAGFQRTLCATMSREIRRSRTVALWLATMHAEQRLASFLLDLADRYDARGYSSREFVLRMSRREIGIHLGLSHETVSRVLCGFHRQSLVLVRGRVLTILDRGALQAL